jgi:hypothetical protein
MPASSPHASHPAETLTTCGFGLERAAKESEKGKTVYQAHVKKSGGEEVEIKVAEDGEAHRRR